MTKRFTSIGADRVNVPYPGEANVVTVDDARRVMALTAEREARRILAETEPNTPDTASFCIERLVGSGRTQDGAGRAQRYVGCVALAEALAAFVDDADTYAPTKSDLVMMVAKEQGRPCVNLSLAE